MIEHNSVFDAVRRGYSEFSYASEDEILNYFSTVETDSIVGHASNIKGILFEQQVVDIFNNVGIKAELFELTNHPGTDIIVNIDDHFPLELQLKATDSASYINQTLADNPDITILATSEIANQYQSDLVLNAGIENIALEHAVFETLFIEQHSKMLPGVTENLTSTEMIFDTDNFATNELVSSNFVEDGIIEAVTDIAIPVSPLGIIFGLLGLPFV